MMPSDWGIDPERVDRNWRAIAFELDAPRPGRIERLLRFARLPAHLTRLVVGTPALRRAWYVAIGLAVVIGISPYGQGQTRESLFPLLLVAPMVPVLGVSMAYGLEADPAHELSVATPLRGLRLVLTRAAVVLAVSSALLAVVALLAPGGPLIAFGWLLPSLGLTTSAVALMTRFTPRRAAMVTVVVWILGVLLVRGGPEGDPLTAFTLPGQLLMGLLAALALVATWLRRAQLDRLDVRW